MTEFKRWDWVVCNDLQGLIDLGMKPALARRIVGRPGQVNRFFEDQEIPDIEYPKISLSEDIKIPYNMLDFVWERVQGITAYHGTLAEPFKKFKCPAHFGTYAQAKSRLVDWFGIEDDSKPFIIHARLHINKAMRVIDQGCYWETAVARAKSLGFDGLVYKNECEAEGSNKDSFVAFFPRQIEIVAWENFETGKKTKKAA